MKPILQALSLLAAFLALNGCKNTGKQASNVGPFDKNGNYVEAWADDPSKWRPYTPKEGEVPTIAKNEQPPDNSVPLAPGSTTTARPPALASHSATGSARVVANSGSRTRGEAEQTVAKNSSRSKSSTDHRTVARKSSRSKSDKDRTVARKSTRPKADTDEDKPSSKTRSTASKGKSKAKSGTVRHTVKPGDSLSSLATKYGTSVSSIKKANGISGTMIRDGKTLVIPK